MTHNPTPTDAQMKLADVTDADVTAALPTESELKLARKCTARANFLLEKKTLQSILNGEQDTWPEVVASILAIRATEARAQGLVEALEACSQWMSDVFPLLGPLKEKWKQADMWSDYDEEVFNRRATLNLQARQALATWRRT